MLAGKISWGYGNLWWRVNEYCGMGTGWSEFFNVWRTWKARSKSNDRGWSKLYSEISTVDLSIPKSKSKYFCKSYLS